MEIREATGNDIAVIFPLWEELMIYHRYHHAIFRYRKAAKKILMDEIKARIQHPDSCVFLAQERGQTLGFIFASFRKISDAFYHNKKGYIAETVVSEKAREKGIGKALYEKAEMWLMDAGVDHIELQVSIHNNRAQKFWKKQGFDSTTYHMAKIIDKKT
jgi:ribosomal protein S18 acetylase RimI-like enzyme